MLHQFLPSHSNVAALAKEIGRARRILLTLSDPEDLRILEAYIDELEAQQNRSARRWMLPRA